jgi:hypothetical protein
VLYCLSLLIAHFAPSFLSFQTIPVFSLLVPTSESRHDFSLLHPLSPSTPEFPLSYNLLYLDPFFLGLCPFHSALNSSIFILLSIFPLFHWHIRSSGSNSFLPSSPCSFSFLFSIASVSSTLPFHPFCLSFPPSFSAYSSCTMFLAFFCPLLAPISNIFLGLYLLLFLLFPDPCLISDHHHSPPEITSPLALSYSPHTSHYLVFLPYVNRNNLIKYEVH